MAEEVFYLLSFMWLTYFIRWNCFQIQNWNNFIVFSVGEENVFLCCSK